MKKPSILLVHCFYQQPGGEDKYVTLLHKLLVQKGHRVIPYFKYNSNLCNSTKLKIKTGLNVCTGKNIQKEIHSLTDKEKPDIAHINNLYPQITPHILPILKKNHIPIIETVHTFRYLCPKGSMFRNNKFCKDCINKSFYYPSIIHGCYHQSRIGSVLLSYSLRKSNRNASIDLIDHYIFPSEYTRNIFIQYFPQMKKKSTVLPHFVPKPKKVASTYKRDYFLYMGRLSEEKGIRELVEVFKSLPDRKLVIAGTGPLYNQIYKNKSPNITMLGFVSETKKNTLYQEALATIIPSVEHYEFGPYSLIESFANGTPVIAPKAGVFLERIRQNRTGFLYNLININFTISRVNSNIVNRMIYLIQKEYIRKYTQSIYYHSIHKLYSSFI